MRTRLQPVVPLLWRLLGLFLIASVATAANDSKGAPTAVPTAPTPRPHVRYAAGGRAVGIPFEIASNKPFVQVRLGGRSLWFILDSGAYNSALDQDTAKSMGVPVEGKDRAEGAGEGSIEEGHLGAVSYSLPGVDLLDQKLIALPLAGLNPVEGRVVEGLLGYDFISQFVVEIDYASRRLSLYDPLTYTYSGKGAVIPLTLEEGWAFVALGVALRGQAPSAGKFLVDTGVRLPLMVSRPFAETHRMAQSAERTLEATVGRGAAGETRGVLARVQRVDLGAMQVASPFVSLSLDQKGFLSSSDYSGILGGEILRRFKVILDYAAHRMILERNSTFAAPFDYDMSGAFVVADGPELSVRRVWRIIPGSPAAEAGLREDDVIESVDGEPAAGFSLDALRERFRQPDKHYRLVASRGGRRLELRLQTRRLL